MYVKFESLYCTPEAYIILYVNHSSIKVVRCGHQVMTSAVKSPENTYKWGLNKRNNTEFSAYLLQESMLEGSNVLQMSICCVFVRKSVIIL